MVQDPEVPADGEAVLPPHLEGSTDGDGPPSVHVGPRKPTVVCGIGASAGGLAPVEQFFDAMASDSGTAFIVVQHLSPDHDSMMASLLSSHTEMPAEQAIDGCVIEADHIYLIPPGTELWVADGRIRLRERIPESKEVPKPIDLLFRTMASAYGSQSVAIVLSGTGSDGSAGIEMVRRAGGLTMTQDSSASFEGMPSAAQRTGFIEAVLDPTSLARVVTDFAVHGERPSAGLELMLDPDEIRILSYLASANNAMDFRDYKPATIHRRIRRRQMMSTADTMAEYAELVHDNEAEQMGLIDDLFIDVTEFFRDHEAFTIIEHEVLPDLIRTAARENRPVRIWVPGCATGEEAYSLTMMVLDLGSRMEDVAFKGVQTFATDVHGRALETASTGEYSGDRLAAVSQETRDKFFTESDGLYRAKPELRSCITFARHNLLTDAPFTRVDLVSCRNLLIYFAAKAQDRAFAAMGFALRRNGALFLGSSESLGSRSPDYRTLSAPWRIYLKDVEESESDTAVRPFLGLGAATPTRGGGSGGGGAARASDPALTKAYDAVMSELVSGGLLVNEKRELIYVMGTGASWLGHAQGRPTLDVLTMISDTGLRLVLGASLRELEGGADTATPRLLGTNFEAFDEPVALQAARIRTSGNQLYYLFFTAPAVAATTVHLAGAAHPDATENGELEALETELRHTRLSLQVALEEQETVNEELNAANEELIASNEELQSTNEELSSVNEELRTLNDEHQRRLDEVLDLSADLEQLMSSTEIGVVFLTEDALVRRFNEPARDYFRIRDQDVGRPFEEIVTTLAYDNLHADVRQIFQTGEGTARAVQSTSHPEHRLIAQVTRYELPRGRWGALVAIVNISNVEFAEEEKLLASAMRFLPGHFAMFDEEGRWVFANTPLGLDRVSAPELIGKRVIDEYGGDEGRQMAEENEVVLATGKPLFRYKHLGGHDLVISKFRVETAAGPQVGALALNFNDVLGRTDLDAALIIHDSVVKHVQLAILDPEGSAISAFGLPDDLPTDWRDRGAFDRLSMDYDSHWEAFTTARSGTRAVIVDSVTRPIDSVSRYGVAYTPVTARRPSPEFPSGSVIVVFQEHGSEATDQVIELEELRAEVARLRGE